MIASLQVGVSRSILRVALGLNAAKQVTAQSLDLPDTFFSMRAPAIPSLTDGRAQELLREWVLENGFRDLAEAVAALLDEVHGVLSVWSLMDGASRKVEVGAEVWNEVMVAGRRAFAQLGVSKKLRKLEQLGLTLDSTLVEQIESINAARNSLVHRHGVVSSGDASNDTPFVVMWTRVAVFAVDETTERELRKFDVVTKDTFVQVRNTSASATFPVGSRITFTAQQFAEIAWTLTVFAESTRTAVEAFGRARGVRFLEEGQRSGAKSDALAS